MLFSQLEGLVLGLEISVPLKWEDLLWIVVLTSRLWSCYDNILKLSCHCVCLCRLEEQQKQALWKLQFESLKYSPFGDSPLFRMGLQVDGACDL